MLIRDRIKELRRVPARELLPNPLNWRQHPKAQAEALQGILAQVGYADALLARETPEGLMLIDGHLRAETTPDQDVPVLVLDVTEDEARVLLASLDPLAGMATTDGAKLAALMEGLQVDSDALRAMLTANNPAPLAEGLTDPDDVPESKETRCQAGDLWLLGEHRVLCGDSTVPSDVERLFGGEQPALILADPPYFGKVDADWDNGFGGYEEFLTFLDGVFALWIPQLLDRGTSGWWCAPDFAWHIEERLRKYAAVFNHIVWDKGASLGRATSVDEMRRWRPRSERLLLCEMQHSPDALLASFNAKTAHIAARSAYSTIIDRMVGWQSDSRLTHNEIDQCLGTNGMAGHYFGRSQWSLPTRDAWETMRPLFKGRNVDIGEFDAQREEFDAQREEFDAQRKEFDAQRKEFDAQRREFDAQREEFDAQREDNFTDVWSMSAPAAAERYGHPTPKPVTLMNKLVSAHSRLGDIVADPFLGSGSTLIAAQQTGRICYGIEIAPHYCDVILKRWEDFTGEVATLAIP